MKELFDEEEAINITIEHGYDGSEFNTKIWKERKCLKPNRTLDALICKLETIYNYVEITGKGKKRKYILKDKKDKMSERIFHYKGSIPTPEDEIMKEYIFNHLLAYKHGFTRSYNGWINTLGFIDTSKFSIDDMVYEIKYLHSGFPNIYNPKEAVSIFIQTLNIRSKDVIEKSFRRLEKEGRIKVNEIYKVKYTNEEYGIISKLDYEEILENVREFLERKGISYYVYSQSLTGTFKTDKMKEIIKQVNKFLSEEFNIKFFFKSFHAIAIDKKIKREVMKKEFDHAYFTRLIKLTIDRQQKEKYNESLSFWKRFYALNTFTLLEYLNIKEVKPFLEEERKLRYNKTDNYSMDILIHYFDNEKEKYSFKNKK